MSQKITSEEFIKKAINIHGDLYNYTKVIFIDYLTPVEIICKTHGIFKLKPRSHVCDKTKCPKCTKPGRTDLNWFLEKAKIVHNNLYDYSNVNYINIITKINIICKQHGIFSQTPNTHLNSKNGCPKCGGKIRYNLSDFIEKANKIHNNYFNYSKVNYINGKTKIEIICKLHGSFWQLAKNHLRGIGCSKCSGKFFSNSEYFIERSNIVHNFLYNYDKVNYIKNNIKVDIVCNNHGLFKQTPHDHLDGHGCPKCTNSVSKMETAWLDFLCIPTEFRNKTIKLDGKLIKPDAIDVNNKIIWEFYGDFWHGNPNKYNGQEINCINKRSFNDLYSATLKKEKMLHKHGYKVISIWESDWNNYV